MATETREARVEKAVTIHAETGTIAVASRPDAPVALIDVLPPVSARMHPEPKQIQLLPTGEQL